MIEVNLIAFDDDNKIMSSYVLEGIQEQDVANKFPKLTNGVYEFLGDRIFLKDLYEIMMRRCPASEKYDARLKLNIVTKALFEYGDFMESVLEWKNKLKFVPRDVMTEYKFMSECRTISNLLDFFEENKEYRFGFLFMRPYE